MPFQVDQVDRQQSGPAAISAYSIALASPVKGLDRPPPGMPSSPMGGSRRTGASFLVREPSQSDVSGSDVVVQTDGHLLTSRLTASLDATSRGDGIQSCAFATSCS